MITKSSWPIDAALVAVLILYQFPRHQSHDMIAVASVLQPSPAQTGPIPLPVGGRGFLPGSKRGHHAASTIHRRCDACPTLRAWRLGSPSIRPDALAFRSCDRLAWPKKREAGQCRSPFPTCFCGDAQSILGCLASTASGGALWLHREPVKKTKAKEETL